MAKLLCLFALVALVQVAYSLDCYSCMGAKCKEDQSKWEKVANCGRTNTNQANVAACLKVVYMDKVTNQEVTNRKCILADKDASGKANFKCNENEGKVITCEACTDNFCNSAPTVSFSYIALVGVLAAFLIPKYL